MVYVKNDINNKHTTFYIISLIYVVLIGHICSNALGQVQDENKEEIPEVLDLATAQRIALENNPTLKIALERIEQAKQRVKQALSQYYPQLIVNYSATHTELPDSVVRSSKDAIWDRASQQISQITSQKQSSSRTTGSPSNSDYSFSTSQSPLSTVVSTLISAYQASENVPEEENRYSLNFILRYTLFDGFSRKYTVLLSRLAEQASEESYLESKRLILSAVANSFYAVQLARENIRIAEADKQFNERLLHEAKVKYEKGAGSLSDILNFEVRLRSAESQIINARQNYEIAKISLAEVMGLQDGVLPVQVNIADLPKEIPNISDIQALDNLVAYAIQHRPDLRMLEIMISQGEARLGQAKSTFYPQVGLSLSKSATRSVDSEFREDDFSTTIGLDVSYTLFAGGKNRALRAEYRHLIREAQHQYYSGKLGVISDVQTALQEFKSALEQLKLQEETAEYVRQNRDLVEKEYRAGQTALVRLNEAQRDLVSAESRLALAKVSLFRAWFQLKTATAQSLEEIN